MITIYTYRKNDMVKEYGYRMDNLFIYLLIYLFYCKGPYLTTVNFGGLSRWGLLRFDVGFC